MARVYTPRARRSRRRARLLPARRADPRARAGLEGLREDGARLQRRLLGRPVRAPAAPGPPLPEPGPPDGRSVAHRAEHDRQLRHEHELAVLRRRDTMSYLTPDGRARGAELRLGRASGWPCSRRSSAASRAARRRRARQLLASTSTARSSTSCCRSRSCSAVILLSQGVPQTFHGHATATTLEGAHQTIARGPVASQIAIKQLGTNGGGFYNSNSAVPFENPNGPHELPRGDRDPADPGRAGVHVRADGARAAPRVDGLRRDVRRSSRSASAIALPAEQHGSQVLRDSGREHHAGARPERRQHGRQGGPLRHRQHGALGDGDDRRLERLRQRRPRRVHAGRRRRAAREHVPRRGRSSAASAPGLYGMFFYILIAVFIAGLMVGRTPEYLGKKIEAREMKSRRSARCSCRRWRWR